MDAKKTVFDAKDLHLSSRLSHPLSVCMHTNMRRESSVGVLNLLFRSFNTPTHTSNMYAAFWIFIFLLDFFLSRFIQASKSKSNL